MPIRSQIDEEKLNRVPSGHPFEYKDVVRDDLPEEEHTEDGKRFKNEVEHGAYNNVKIEKNNGSHMIYRKL